MAIGSSCSLEKAVVARGRADSSRDTAAPWTDSELEIAWKNQKQILENSCQGGFQSQKSVSSCEQGENKFLNFSGYPFSICYSGYRE